MTTTTTTTTLVFNPKTKEISINSPMTGGYRYIIGANTEFALSNYNDPALSVDGAVELFLQPNLEARHKAVLRRWGISNIVPTVCEFELGCDDGRIARVVQTTMRKSHTQNHIWWHVTIE